MKSTKSNLGPHDTMAHTISRNSQHNKNNTRKLFSGAETPFNINYFVEF